MKVQTKILLLLFVLVAVFAGGLLWIKARERAKFRDIARERAEESQRAFDAAIARQDERLETFAKDSTYSDAMVRAVTTDDRPGSTRPSTRAPGRAAGPTPSGFTTPTAACSFPPTCSTPTTSTTCPCPRRPSTRWNTSITCISSCACRRASWRCAPPRSTLPTTVGGRRRRSGFFIAGQLWSTGDHGVIGDLARGSGNTSCS